MEFVAFTFVDAKTKRQRYVSRRSSLVTWSHALTTHDTIEKQNSSASPSARATNPVDTALTRTRGAIAIDS